MQIVRSVPPLFPEIDAAFNVAGRAVVFAWGDKIYNPLGGDLAPEILVHEQVHGDRQLAFAVPQDYPADPVIAWWKQYIADPAFRLAEELPAHVAEFKALCELHRSGWHSARAMRRTMAAHVARKLSAPLYGRLISFEVAKQQLLAA